MCVMYMLRICAVHTPSYRVSYVSVTVSGYTGEAYMYVGSSVVAVEGMHRQHCLHYLWLKDVNSHYISL